MKFIIHIYAHTEVAVHLILRVLKSNLNNKGRLDGDISSMFVGLLTLDLRNDAMYEYEIFTVYSCDNTLKSEVKLLMYFNYFWNKLRFTKYQSLLYISISINLTNLKF